MADMGNWRSFLGLFYSFLGNAYKDPVMSLHSYISREFKTDVTILASLWYQSKMTIFSYEGRNAKSNIHCNQTLLYDLKNGYC